MLLKVYNIFNIHTLDFDAVNSMNDDIPQYLLYNEILCRSIHPARMRK